jgi:hypothetical protein
MEAFYQTYADIFLTIEGAFKKDRFTPGLMLLYATIDGFSYLANIGDKDNGDAVKEWINKWMLPKYPMPCSADDIWSARCGMLHKQRSISNKTISGMAKEIQYVFKGYSGQKMQLVWDLVNPGKTVVISVEDLMWSFRHGIVDCLDEIKKDTEWQRSFEKKAKYLSLIIKPIN